MRELELLLYSFISNLHSTMVRFIMSVVSPAKPPPEAFTFHYG